MKNKRPMKAIIAFILAGALAVGGMTTAFATNGDDVTTFAVDEDVTTFAVDEAVTTFAVDELTDVGSDVNGEEIEVSDLTDVNGAYDVSPDEDIVIEYDAEQDAGEQDVLDVYDDSDLDGYDEPADEAGTEEDASGETVVDTGYVVNPLYEDAITQEDLEDMMAAVPNTLSDNNVTHLGLFDDADTAGDALRPELVDRTATTIRFEYDLGYVPSDIKGKAIDIINAKDDVITAAFKHTGNGSEGDYLSWQYAGYGYETQTEDYQTYTIDISFYWYTDAGQEARVTSELNDIYASFDGDTDYEKLYDIYEYITGNVTYDSTNLNNSDNKLKYTAYAALINGTAICQGYANLFYRMANDCGIDCRMEAGTGNSGAHAWNIAQIGDYYYFCDATWDAGYFPFEYNYPEIITWRYFLNGSDTFLEKHTLNSGYTEEAWTSAYPMSATNYTASGAIFAVYCEEDGSLTFYTDTSVPSEGELYNGKTVTNIYSVIEQTNYSSPGSVPWTSLKTNIADVVIDSSFTEAQPISLAYWFYGMRNANFAGLENIDTSAVTTLAGTFEDCHNLTNVDALASWDTSKVTTLDETFLESAIMNVDGLSSWDTSNVTTLSYTFMYCYNLDDLNGLASWDTSAVTTLENIFMECPITDVDALAKWNTSNVTNMSSMFYDCSSLTNLDGLASWDTGKVTTLEAMLDSCTGLINADGLASWDTSNVTTLEMMFFACFSLERLDVSKWDTANVTNMNWMFMSCDSLTTIYSDDDVFVVRDEAISDDMFDCVSLIGGKGTKFSSSQADMAHVDTEDNPGYFTEYTYVLEKVDEYFNPLPNAWFNVTQEVYDEELGIWKTQYAYFEQVINEELKSYDYVFIGWADSIDLVPDGYTSTIISDWRGECRIIGMLTGIDGSTGDYYLDEIKAPDGYVKYYDLPHFRVDYNGLVYQCPDPVGDDPILKEDKTVIVKNGKATHELSMTKTDENGTIIHGAEFNIYDSDGNMLYFTKSGQQTYTICDSDTEGATNTVTIGDDIYGVYIEGLVEGEYIIVETKAPYGYILSQIPVYVTVNERGTILESGNAKVINNELYVINTKALVMPNAGGFRTLLAIIIGSAVIAAAVVYDAVGKRRKKGIVKH